MPKPQKMSQNIQKRESSRSVEAVSMYKTDYQISANNLLSQIPLLRYVTGSSYGTCFKSNYMARLVRYKQDEGESDYCVYIRDPHPALPPK